MKTSFVLVILACDFEKYFHLCCVRSVCWIPDSSWRLSKHSHYNGAAPTVSEHCLMNINTLLKGHCHSHECISKKKDVTPHLAFVIQTWFKRAEKTEESWSYRNTVNETGAAARRLAFNSSASSHETSFFHIRRRTDGGGLSSFFLLTVIKWSTEKMREMFVGDIPKRACHAKAISRYRLSRSAGRRLIWIN